MTWCDGCNQQTPQTSLHLTPDNHLQYLCTPCWQWADYYDDDIGPHRWHNAREVAA